MNKYELIVNVVHPLIYAVSRVPSLQESVMTHQIREKMKATGKLGSDVDELLEGDGFTLRFQMKAEYKPSTDEMYELAKAVRPLTQGTVLIGGMQCSIQLI